MELDAETLERHAEWAGKRGALVRIREMGLMPMLIDFTREHWGSFAHDDQLILAYLRQMLADANTRGMSRHEYRELLKRKFEEFKNRHFSPW